MAGQQLTPRLQKSLIAAQQFGRSSSSGNLINIELTSNGTILPDGTTSYTRRVLTYTTLSNLTAGGGSGAGGALRGGRQAVLNVSVANFNTTSNWQVLVTGGHVDVVFSAAPVPEPGHVLLICAGVLGLGLLMRRQRDMVAAQG
ncbi:MAG: PEP-CTERM sorting domain-containing protein [Hyphomicrobium sp.]|uniref:PEP-CTERM sorting domain-containing protein n=1 Tax=Hyphomicrobium sp. TaxID=82 RepID=UPI0039E6E2BC